MTGCRNIRFSTQLSEQAATDVEDAYPAEPVLPNLTVDVRLLAGAPPELRHIDSVPVVVYPHLCRSLHLSPLVQQPASWAEDLNPVVFAIGYPNSTAGVHS